MKVGVLALQGDVPEHAAAARRLLPADGVTLVRTAGDLAEVDALLLPGGESTTIANLLQQNRLWDPLGRRLREGLGVLATCAGLILLARTLERSPVGRDPPTFGVLDVAVRRNDYGAQRESFEAPIDVDGVGGGAFPGIFIRAPRILATGPDVTVIARHSGEVVGVRSGRIWGFTFHPELSGDSRILAAFLESLVGPPYPDTARKTKATTATSARKPRTTATQKTHGGAARHRPKKKGTGPTSTNPP
jgi:pyridoxal 5'-phosphate synthase pdxT subunit